MISINAQTADRSIRENLKKNIIILIGVLFPIIIAYLAIYYNPLFIILSIVPFLIIWPNILLTIYLTYVNLITLQFELFMFIRPHHILLALLLALVFSWFIAGKKRIDLGKIFPLELGLFFLFMLFSLFNAREMVDSFRMITIYLNFYLMTVLVLLWANYYGYKDSCINKLNRIIIASGFILALLGLGYYLAGILGIDLPFAMRGIKVKAMHLKSIIPRLGFTEDPNHFATFLLPSLILSLPVKRRPEGNKLNLLSKQGIIFSIILLAYLLTLSLGGYIALALCLFFINRTYKILKPRYLVGFIMLLVILSPLVWQSFNNGNNPMLGIFSNAIMTQKSGSSQARFISWVTALRLGAQNPLTGVGPDNAKYYVAEVDKDKALQDIHNGYLQIFAEQGVIAFVFFVGILFLYYSRLQKAIVYYAGQQQAMSEIGVRYSIIFIGTIVGHLFLSLFFTPVAYLVFAMAYIYYFKFLKSAKEVNGGQLA